MRPRFFAWTKKEDRMLELAAVVATLVMGALTLAAVGGPKPDERAVRVHVEEDEEGRREDRAP